MLKTAKIKLFDPTNPQHKTAADLFDTVADLALVCPHGHIDPGLFSDPLTKFQDPAALFVIPDHYVFRMLVSHGLTHEQLGVMPFAAIAESYNPLEVWQAFCDYFSLFDGTPSGLWIENALSMVFGIDEKPNSDNATALFNQIQLMISSEGFTPRKLYEDFNIEVLCTTDAAVSVLTAHQAIQQSGWQGQVRPTFRPDSIVKIDTPGWRDQIEKLSEVSGTDIHNFASFIHALEQQRAYFKSMGAVAADHDVQAPYTCRLSAHEAEALFQRALNQSCTVDDVKRFSGLMIFESARMSLEDGLVMQLHAGSFRNYNSDVYQTYGADMGFDIPVSVEWTHNLKPLLDAFGMDKRLQMVLFSLDESAFARELAPIAGAFPTIKLGPPWWFYDSPAGMLRYFDAVMETAGIDNTVGFNDDTRAFLSIPARHDMWRRMTALWLAKLVHRGQIDRATAEKRMYDLAYGLVKKSYRLP